MNDWWGKWGSGLQGHFKLCPTFFYLFLCVGFRELHEQKGNRTMWRVAVFVLLLLSMDMQVKGATDKMGGSVEENPRLEKREKTDKGKGSNTTPVSDTASPGFLGNLLVIPMDGSHWVDLKALAQEMGRRGHRVTVVMPEVNIRMGPGKHYDTVIYPVPYDKSRINSIIASNTDLMKKSSQSFMEKIKSRFAQIQTIKGFIETTAESLLFNASLISHLAQQVSPTHTEGESAVKINQ